MKEKLFFVQFMLITRGETWEIHMFFKQFNVPAGKIKLQTPSIQLTHQFPFCVNLFWRKLEVASKKVLFFHQLYSWKFGFFIYFVFLAKLLNFGLAILIWSSLCSRLSTWQNSKQKLKQTFCSFYLLYFFFFFISLFWIQLSVMKNSVRKWQILYNPKKKVQC